MSTSVGFVGRRGELRVLEEGLAAAQQGHPKVVYIEAEAGAGKSTLLSRFVASLSNAVVLEIGGDESETLLSYGVIDQLQPGTVTEPGTDPMAAGARLVDLLDHLQADSQVVVLAIDDLQWADRPSLRAMLFALRRLRADRVLTAVTSRAGELADPGWARFAAGDGRVTRIHLGGLSPDDVIELASALGQGTLSRRGASRLVAHTEGNPLYCRALLEEIGVARLNAGEDGLPAPRELSGLILTRVAALSVSTQEFVAAASVLGQHAPLSTIAAVAQLPYAQDEMDESVAAGLLSEGRVSELSFTHPLYRAAIYADLSPTNRRRLHARAAELATGRPRLAHRVAASVGPEETLANELEASALASAAAGDADASAWAIEQAALLSAAGEDRERRFLDSAGFHLDSANTSAAARALASCHVTSARRDALTGLLGVLTGSPGAEGRLLAAWLPSLCCGKSTGQDVVDVPDRLRRQWPARMWPASGPLTVMVPAACSTGRPTVYRDVTGHDCGPALPEDDKPFVGQDSQGVLQCRDPHALKRAHLLDRGQRFARREHPGADCVPKRAGHLLPGRPAARSNDTEGRHVPVLNGPLAGAPGIATPSQLRVEQIEEGPADLTDLQMPERRLDNTPDVRLISLPRRQVPVGHRGVLVHELGHGRVGLWLAASLRLLEQPAELDLRRPFGLAGLPQPDLAARQRIGPSVDLHPPGAAR